jgi:predicted nucleic acid-binding protein
MIRSVGPMAGIVIDTSVLVAALRSKRGASFRLLEMAGDSRVQLNISVALALEYEAIGKREAEKLGIPGWAIDDIVNVVQDEQASCDPFSIASGTFRP